MRPKRILLSILLVPFVTVLLLVIVLYVKRYFDATEIAYHVNDAIERFHKQVGHYPASKRDLIPEFLDRSYTMKLTGLRLIDNPQDPTYRHLVDTGKLKPGEIQLRYRIRIKNSSCVFIDGSYDSCITYIY